MRITISLIVFFLLTAIFSFIISWDVNISPTSTFYFIRTFQENIQSELIFNNNQKFQWHYRLAQKKLEDVANLVSLGKLGLLPVILEEYKGEYGFLKQQSAQNPDFQSKMVELAGLQTKKLISLFDVAFDKSDKRAILSSIIFLQQINKLSDSCDFLKSQSQNSFWNEVERTILKEKYEKTCSG